jgi:hypothetical protein
MLLQTEKNQRYTMSLDREIWFALSQKYELRKRGKDFAFFKKKACLSRRAWQKSSRNKARNKN